MAIDWDEEQRKDVASVLAAHPVISGRCLNAAREITPLASNRDPDARPWRIQPLEGRFVVPAASTDKRWFHHYTVEVEAHCVDALTGVDGTMKADYLQTHWRYPEALEWVETDLGDDI